jgi:hypothetical protein
VTPVGAPQYAIAAVRKFNETTPLGADYSGHDGLVFQNLTANAISIPTLGEDASGRYHLAEGLGLAGFEAAYAARAGLGSRVLDALGAGADWVTLAPEGSQMMSARGAGFTASGTLTNPGDAFYLISPKLGGVRRLDSPRYLLVGREAETQIQIQITNLNLDAADDLQVSSVTSSSGVSISSAQQSFTLAEGQSRIIEATATAGSRGNLSVDLSSNDFFDPESSVTVAQGVAPSSGLTVKSIPGTVRAGQLVERTVEVSNRGDGNLSGLGEESNLRGTVSGSDSTGVQVSFADGGINLADSGKQTYAYTIQAFVNGNAVVEIGAAFANGSPDGRNAAHDEFVSKNLTIVGPEAEFRWTDTEGSKSVITPGGGNSVTFEEQGAIVSFTLANLFATGGALSGLNILSATLSGENADQFSLSGFQNGLISTGGSELLGILANGNGLNSALLTLETDYLAANGLGTPGESFTFNLTQIPEPSTALLTVLGALALLRRNRPAC